MDDITGTIPAGPSVVPGNIEAVRASGLFDASLYASRIDRHLPEDELIVHYLSEGEAQGLSASNIFDLNFYKMTNPDVAEYSDGYMLHYIKHGEMEGRYPSLAELAVDAAKVEKSGLFSSPRSPSSPSLIVLPPVESYLLFWRYGYRANAEFDDSFYWNAYADAQAYQKPPIIHYIDIGQKQLRLTNKKQLAEIKAEIEPFFDKALYRRNAGLLASEDDPVEHYLTVGRFRGFDPAADFSVNYYRQRYPDIAQQGVDPFLHFVRFVKGRGDERRVGRPDFTGRIKRGKQPYIAGKPTVLVVNHDASRTGAPLVGLEAARHFSQVYNVLVYCQREGELIEAFAAVSMQVVFGPVIPADAEDLVIRLRDIYRLDAILLNSVETSAFAKAALDAGIPTLALIHEFAEYTFPIGRMAHMIAAVDRAIVPAQLVLESVQREAQREFGSPAQNLVVRPQGCLPTLPKGGGEADLNADEILARLKVTGRKKPPIVLGAGFIHIRKGVELFVQAAHEVRRHIADVRFVWVGAGYEPRRDGAYSVWIEEAIQRLGLQDTVFFLLPQSEMDLILELSDVFFLSSRMDPFPSIVLDALEAGKQVVCFQNATGAADLFTSGKAHGAAVEYGNVNAAADAVVRILRAAAGDSARINRALVERDFRFTDYCALLEQEIAKAKAFRIRLEEACGRILASEAFDAEFHNGADLIASDAIRACRDYVARGMKGLTRYNPRPGFNDGLYRGRHEVGTDVAALDHALAMHGDFPTTHRCVILKHPTLRPQSVGRVGLHVHLYYPELAPEFVQRLNTIGQPMDVFVTTTGHNERVQAEYHFLQYEHGDVRYVDVPNRGRDIGPFLTELREPLARGNYDIVGHLHAKRSLAVDPQMGDRWRTYLLDTLLGDAFLALANLFAGEERLGLVFAEDRHSVGWNDNYAIAQKLAQRMKPAVSLPPSPCFPLGTMFWARPAALAPLWQLGLKMDDFPPEPVAYDGTILHAIERMLPSVCEAAGYSWCTVYDRRRSW